MGRCHDGSIGNNNLDGAMRLWCRLVEKGRFVGVIEVG